MISIAEVEAAQTAWAEAIIDVGAAPSWDEAHARATQLVQRLYHLEDGSLLFCPTMAADQQFRGTLKDAVSYFVGRDADHAEDHGFALNSWVQIRFENAGVVTKSDASMAMGNYFFRAEGGSEVKVEYTFVYVRDSAGAIKIQLHHSALPYTPAD